MTDETIEKWAKRMYEGLTDAQWREVQEMVDRHYEGANAGEDYSYTRAPDGTESADVLRALALLAHRDKARALGCTYSPPEDETP